jgi:hypothetical protein
MEKNTVGSPVANSWASTSAASASAAIGSLDKEGVAVRKRMKRLKHYRVSITSSGIKG